MSFLLLSRELINQQQLMPQVIHFFVGSDHLTFQQLIFFIELLHGLLESGWLRLFFERLIKEISITKEDSQQVFIYFCAGLSVLEHLAKRIIFLLQELEFELGLGFYNSREQLLSIDVLLFNIQVALNFLTQLLFNLLRLIFLLQSVQKLFVNRLLLLIWLDKLREKIVLYF
jgi:hypothetical protein